MPPGRFVAGATQTSLGKVRVIGVCIPWFRSRTEARRGLQRKRPWEDHAQYLAGLTEILRRQSVKHLIVMGDFNQALGPSSRAPLELKTALVDAFPPNMEIVTPDLSFQGRRSIDHIASSDDLKVESPGVISNIHDGREISDHFGVVVGLSLQSSTNPCH